MKSCNRCGVKKSLNEFYNHSGNNDSHDNTCKECRKFLARERYKKNKQAPEWRKKERRRCREKYYRLNYKDRYKQSTEDRRDAIKHYQEKYPEKVRARNRSSHINGGDNGYHWHHWSYKEGYEKDLILLNESDHYKAHRFMVYDSDEMLYRNQKGDLLDTTEKHIKYLKSIDIEIINSKLHG